MGMKSMRIADVPNAGRGRVLCMPVGEETLTFSSAPEISVRSKPRRFTHSLKSLVLLECLMNGAKQGGRTPIQKTGYLSRTDDLVQPLKHPGDQWLVVEGTSGSPGTTGVQDLTDGFKRGTRTS